MRISLLLVLLAAAPVMASEEPAAEDPAALVAALGAKDAAVRSAAHAKLVQAGEAAVPALREGIASSDVAVVLGSLDVAAAAGLRRTREAVLVRAANADEPVLTRRTAIRTMGRVGDYRDLKLLGRLLDDWPEAALALASIGDRDALPDLRKRLSGDDVAPEVPYALAALGEDSALDLLVAQVGREGRVGLRALLLIRRYAGTDAGADRASWEAWLRVERLARRLGAADWEASESALAAVFHGLDGDAKAARVADLLAIAKDAARPLDQRTKSIRALGVSGATDVTTPLLDLLFEDPDGHIRVYSAEAIGRLGRMDAAVDLVWYLVNDEDEFRKLSAKNLTNPYYTVDSAVSNSLVRMGVIGGLDYMIRQLGQSHRVRVYHQAVRTLRTETMKNFGFRPDAREADRLAAAERWREWFDEHRDEIPRRKSAGLDDPEFRRRVRELVDGLGQWKFLAMSRARQKLHLIGEPAIPELVLGLKRPSVHIRTHCAEVLGWLRARGARSALAEALGDSRFEVRTAAAAALATMGPGEAAEALVKALGDPSPDMFDVRIEAVLALARAPSSVALPAIDAALGRKENDSDTFRREAWFARAAHGDRDAFERLVATLDRKEIAWRQVVALRIRALTGRDPGVTDDSIVAFREWWGVNRERYTPREPYGTGR